ncbi:cytochrome c-type biogenesis protein [Marinagarivorans algicola]|uniref:cytochrome c-type biogenesis protein n=1 Tax=Marinagarivorans algicola TaxID=1513270 RepID=UPI0009EA7339|nr:cytochrome c-type biogenesis protein [Marinagarivorans algicola]
MLKRLSVFLVYSLVALAGARFAHAGIDTYEFDDLDDRARYNQFIEELRCPKCKNQNLVGSNAPIAKDLRRELHRLILEGETDDGIITFMVDRYGDFVLYRPPLQKNTYILWYGPIAMLLGALLVLGLIIFKRSRKPSTGDSLTGEEQAQFESFLKSTDEKNAQDGGVQQESTSTKNHSKKSKKK